MSPDNGYHLITVYFVQKRFLVTVYIPVKPNSGNLYPKTRKIMAVFFFLLHKGLLQLGLFIMGTQHARADRIESLSTHEWPAFHAIQKNLNPISEMHYDQLDSVSIIRKPSSR